MRRAPSLATQSFDIRPNRTLARSIILNLELGMFIGVRILSALLAATSPSSFPSRALVLAAVVQLEQSPKKYEDGPQTSGVSRLHVIETVSRKHLLKTVEPEYPPRAEATGIEGDVIFRIVIGKNGKVKEIHLQRGRPILIEAAAKAMSRWMYKSFTLNGEAVEVETLATVQFRLRGMHQGKTTDN